ncbi:protein TolQ [Nitrospirota bacterium]
MENIDISVRILFNIWMHGNVMDLIWQAGLVVKFVMLLLLFFSVISWAIIIMKFFSLSSAEKENEIFAHSFRKARDMEHAYASSKKFLSSPLSNVFRAVYGEAGANTDRESLMRSIKRYESLEMAKLESNLGFLATCGSATPFIGLFGTVWGIMDSFMNIGQAGSASLAVVAPGIAEALIATAMGLVAAIPAVIAYNYYLTRTRRLILEMEDFGEEALSALTREISNEA